jgi:hypothetical protein
MLSRQLCKKFIKRDNSNHEESCLEMMMPKEIKKEGLEYLYHEQDLYSIVLRGSYKNESVSFFTPENFSQQLGYIPHAKGDLVKPHEHRLQQRITHNTQEVLVVTKGRVKVNFYDGDHRPVFSEILNTGDIILLCSGGHGFEFLEDTIMIEVKQGPYSGDHDKLTFEEMRHS